MSANTEVTRESLLKELPEIGMNLLATRKGNGADPGVDLSLDEFLKGKYGFSQADYLEKIEVNTRTATINNLFTMPDQSVRWVVPEILRDALTLGIRQAPIYPNLIISDQAVNGLQVTMPFINMSDAAPARVNEAETIPLGTISYGQKMVNLFKIGKGIKITDEVKNYVSLDVVSIFFRDHGIQLGYAMDALMFDVVLNGNQLDGSEAAAVIGVGTPTPGVGFQYRDFLRVWIRAARMGRNFQTLVGGEDAALDVLDLPEFKERQAGTTYANLTVKSPVPRDADFYIHGAIPDGSILMIDPSAAIIKLTAQPLMLESERIVSNQTEAYYSSLTTGFAKMYHDASLVMDQSLDFATNGFPSYMNIDPLLLVNLE